jgi:predicted membrane metal-binding protein
MHISFIFMLALRIMQYVWPCSLYNRLLLNKFDFSYLMAWSITGFYSYISGFSLPTQRAFIAVTMLLLTKMLKIKIASFNVFAICIILVLLYDPDLALVSRTVNINNLWESPNVQNSKLSIGI